MKKVLLLILLVNVLLMDLRGQTYFPLPADNPRWEVYRTAYSSTSGMVLDIIDYYYGASVEYCDATYIEVIEDHRNGYSAKLGYVRIDDERVYVLSDTICIYEAILYDFNLAEQDSIICGYNMNYQGNASNNLFSVRSISQIEQYGIQRRVQEMEYNRYPNWDDSATTMNWIAGVGSSKNPFYALSCIGDGCEIEDALSQLSLNGEVVYDNFMVHVDNTPVDDDLVKVYPTVFFQQLNIEGNGESDYRIRLFDASGKCQLEKIISPMEAEVHVSGISPGVYFLEIINAKTGRIKIEKVIKKP